MRIIFPLVKQLILMGMILLCPTLVAEDLIEVYQAVLKHDPVWLAKEYEYQAGKQAAGQGRAVLMPTIVGTGEKGKTKDKLLCATPPCSSEEYDSANYQVQLSQPIFNLETWHQYKELKANAKKSEHNYEENNQINIYETAVIYFDVLRSQDDLKLANAEEQALLKQLDTVRQRVEAGLATQTELLEAQAAFDLARVNQITTEGLVKFSKEILTTHTGIQNPIIAKLKADYPIEHIKPLDENHWVELAKGNSHNLKSVQLDSEIAHRSYKRNKAKIFPKVDLVANYRKIDSDAAQFRSIDSSQSVGVQLSVPIFSGFGDFYVSKENKMRYFQTREENLAESKDLEQNTKNRFRSIYTDVLRARAYKTSVESLEKALQAIEAEHESGARDLIDLLEAQKSLFAAKKDYAHARYDYVLDKLQLQQFIGDLDENDLNELNQWMEY